MNVISCTGMWGDVECDKREEGLVNTVSKLFYKAVDPPLQKLCGTDGGPPVTATRIMLRDGRYLAYSEFGVAKEKANYKIVFSHGFTGSRNDSVRASQMEALCTSTLSSLLSRRARGRISFTRSISSWIRRSSTGPRRAKIRDSPDAPPITVNRIRLNDGRHLAYDESGVNLADARFKIVFSHGFTGSRFDKIRASPELIEELGVYMVGFDRPGYGESDPNPNRSVRTAALDIEELADTLGLGRKFHLVGMSIGNHAVWGALKYIPERLAGVVLMAPVINYRWPGFPPELASSEYNKQQFGDQWALRVSYYAPSILHWWMEQSWLPTSTVIKGTTYLPNKGDEEIRRKGIEDGSFDKKKEVATQQGKHESFYREMKVMFGKWEFDPMDLPEPDCPVHMFQGDEDGLVPVELQRHIVDRLDWINYHELPCTGHYLSAVPGLGDRVLRALFGKSDKN